MRYSQWGEVIFPEADNGGGFGGQCVVGGLPSSFYWIRKSETSSWDPNVACRIYSRHDFWCIHKVRVCMAY